MGSADLNLDPLFKSACAYDLNRYCLDLPAIDAQQTQCLLRVLNAESSGGSGSKGKLKAKCEMYVKMRIQMLPKAVETLSEVMEDLRDLYTKVTTNPNKNYLILILSLLVCCIFLFGLLCGRATRRARKEYIHKVR